MAAPSVVQTVVGSIQSGALESELDEYSRTYTLTLASPMEQGNHVILVWHGFGHDTGGTAPPTILDVSDSEGNIYSSIRSRKEGHLGLIVRGSYLQEELPSGATFSMTLQGFYQNGGRLIAIEVNGASSDGVFGALDSSTGTSVRQTAGSGVPVTSPFSVGTSNLTPSRENCLALTLVTTAVDIFNPFATPASYASWGQSSPSGLSLLHEDTFQLDRMKFGFPTEVETRYGVEFEARADIVPVAADDLAGTATIAPPITGLNGASAVLIYILLKPAVGGGIDLAQTPNGWLYRAHNDAGLVKVGQSKDAATTWETVNIDNDASADSPVALVSNNRGDLALFYHTSAGDLRIWQRPRYVGTWAASNWSDVGTVTGLRFPVACVLGRQLLIALHSNTDFRIYTSEDLGTSSTLLATIAGVDQQLVALRADRRGIAHLLTRTSGGALQHRWSRDGATWSTPTTLVTTSPAPELLAFAVGLRDAFLAYFVNATLTARVTDETYGADAGSSLVPTGFTYATVRPGVLYDHRGDLIMVARDDADTLRVRYRRHSADTWKTPV
jgi:hypothetical protein